MPDIQPDPYEKFQTDIETMLSESVWRRGWKDTKERWSSVGFWIAELGVGAAVTIYFGELQANLLIALTMLSAFALFGIVGIAAVLTAPIRQRDDARNLANQLIPDFSLDFGPSKAFMHRTYLGSPDYPCTYVRILPRPHSLRVMGCSGWLTNIEFKDGEGGFLPTDFTGTDSLQLAWSMRGDKAYDEINLIRDVNRYLDVLWTAGHKKGFYMCVEAMPNWLSDITVNVGIYRITIKVVSANGKSEFIRLLVDWSRNWEEMQVREYSDGDW